MSKVRRIYVEKKDAFAVKAEELQEEIQSFLGIEDVKGVRVLIRYDVENISDEVFERACRTVFSEPPVDMLYEETFEIAPDAKVFSVEYLPGQFDQRADSAVQCVRFLKEDEQPVIRTATTYVIEGGISDEELASIKSYCINPVDSREAAVEKPETLVTVFDEPADVKIFDGFCDMDETALKELYSSLNLAMTFRDFQHIQNYFRGEEHRNPSMTEIRVLDTYWSDHCRHTTFSTELKNVTFGDGDYRKPMEATYEEYLKEYADYKGRKPEDFFGILDELKELASGFKTLEEWENHIASIRAELLKQAKEREMSSDGVILSTMHSSKGLEYRIVFIIDANEGITPHKRVLFEEDMEEERRLFYVAMTRAKELLYIFSVRKLYGKKAEQSRFVEELLEE